MAEQLKELTQTAYPWAKWHNGRPWRVREGEDFDCTVPGFRQTLYSHAKVIGMRVVSVVPEEGVVEFQFSKGVARG